MRQPPDLTDLLNQANWDARQAKCATPEEVRVALLRAGWNFDWERSSGVAVSRDGVISVWAHNADGGTSQLSNLDPVWVT